MAVITIDDVLKHAERFEEMLTDFYKEIFTHFSHEKIQSLFESLVRCEQRDEVELKKIKAMDYF